ncbi:hypothetical protein BKA70DRAFT_1419527 [Coprinopsis sp. MPI-PUGE-AT-0042]|nr:hypothetical protein BKA70DRAFT_1419527 [Coprinopsis sp. MPI-PUGE-AT-0042]
MIETKLFRGQAIWSRYFQRNISQGTSSRKCCKSRKALFVQVCVNHEYAFKHTPRMPNHILSYKPATRAYQDLQRLRPGLRYSALPCPLRRRTARPSKRLRHRDTDVPHNPASRDAAAQITSAEHTVKITQFAPSGTSAFGVPPWSSTFGVPSTTSAFGSTTQSSTSAFGAPSNTPALGGLISPMAMTTFDTPALGSAFGQTCFGGGSTTIAASATTAPTFALGQPAFVQWALQASAQPPRGSSLIKTVSGFGAYAGGGTIAFGTSITTSAPAALTHPFAAVAADTPARVFLCGQSAFSQTNTPAVPTTTAFGASAQLQEGMIPAFANLVNPLNRRPHSQDALFSLSI